MRTAVNTLFTKYWLLKLLSIGMLIIATAHVFVDGRECTSQSAMDNVTLHHNDSSDRVYKIHVHNLLKLMVRSE